LIVALAALAFTVVSVFVIDVPLARLIGTPPSNSAAWNHAFTAVMETAFGMTLSKFALGGALIALGLIVCARHAWRGAGLQLLFIGLTHLTARLVAGVLKNVFERLRPFQVQTTGWHDVFFSDGGGSMPSGHAAHFWALYFPLALLFPRTRWILLPLPLSISIARVLINDHYLSDVVASAAIAALVTWAYAERRRPGGWPGGVPPPSERRRDAC
jgi:membrane-associated phospholipid phosphatase